MHLENSEKLLITNYSEGSISVNRTEYLGSILVGGEDVVENWYDGPVAELSLDHLSHIVELKPEILIFGSGREHTFPPARLIAELSQKGIAMEVMNTKAACRTYNVLVSEFRDVSAALLPIEAGKESGKN